MTASHRKPRLPFSITPTGTRMKRWHIDRRDTPHDDFVIVRWLGDGDVLMCRRPGSCTFNTLDRRRLISTARVTRMEAAQELHGIGNA